MNKILISSFISNQVICLNFCCQYRIGFALIKNVGGTTKYLQVMNYRLSGLAPSLKRGYFTLMNNKMDEQIIFYIRHTDELFSQEKKEQVRVRDHCSRTLKNPPYEALNYFILLLKIKKRKFVEYTCYFKVFCC